jgi:hypothetical protein
MMTLRKLETVSIEVLCFMLDGLVLSFSLRIPPVSTGPLEGSADVGARTCHSDPADHRQTVRTFN